MVNRLRRLDEFKEILDDYRISDAGKKLLQEVKLVIMVGPTSAGRNTIIEALVNSGEYYYIVSDTTRHPRENNGVMEQNGREYWFRSEEEVLSDLKSGKFLEAAIIHNQQVSGISLRELEKAKREGKVAVNEIEIVGARNILEAKPDTYLLFVVPPNFDVWMKRLDGRGKLSNAEKRRRLESASLELKDALENDKYLFIVNNEFHESVGKIHELVFEGKHSDEQQKHGRRVTEELLAKTRELLSSESK